MFEIVIAFVYVGLALFVMGKASRSNTNLEFQGGMVIGFALLVNAVLLSMGIWWFHHLLGAVFTVLFLLASVVLYRVGDTKLSAFYLLLTVVMAGSTVSSLMG